LWAVEELVELLTMEPLVPVVVDVFKKVH
jgi:hypothetical protein